MKTKTFVLIPLFTLFAISNYCIISSGVLQISYASAGINNSSDNYSNYLKETTDKSINLTKTYNNEIALWNSHKYSNTTMAKITETFLPKFVTQLNQFNNTEAPAKYSKVKENYVKSFAYEIKSYQFFDEFLKTNDSIVNNLSNDYLSAALNYETIARKAFAEANNNSTSNGIGNNSSIVWSKYSNASNGISFDYPSTWKINYYNIYGPEINVTNPDRLNGIIIGLPDQNLESMAKQYPSLKDFANNLYSKMIGMTIIEPFNEKIMAGSYAVVGKISSAGPISTFAYIMHNGHVYSFQYVDTPDKYKSTDSQDIMNRIILSFNIHN